MIYLCLFLNLLNPNWCFVIGSGIFFFFLLLLKFYSVHFWYVCPFQWQKISSFIVFAGNCIKDQEFRYFLWCFDTCVHVSVCPRQLPGFLTLSMQNTPFWFKYCFVDVICQTHANQIHLCTIFKYLLQNNHQQYVR